MSRNQRFGIYVFVASCLFGFSSYCLWHEVTHKDTSMFLAMLGVLVSFGASCGLSAFFGAIVEDFYKKEKKL